MEKNQREMINMGFVEESFPRGTHLCMIFNDERERQKSIFKFLAAGLTANEKVDYLVDTKTPQEFMDAFLENIDEDLKKSERLRNLNLWVAENTYCPHGNFVPNDMLNTLGSLYTQAREKGFSNARASGEMTWALKGIPGSGRLMEYESLINELVVTHPITAVCQYDTNCFDGKTIFDVLRVHPMVISHGQIIQNPFYMKPQDFLKEYAGRK